MPSLHRARAPLHLAAQRTAHLRSSALLPRTATTAQHCDTERDDASFIALLNAYRPTGGLLRGDDLADLQAMRDQGDRVALARSIVAGEILCFEWNRTFWVPAFQLDRDSLLVASGARSVLAELSRAFDSWLAAQWFVAPNAWLRGGAPVDLMVSDLPAVIDAARADRFIATG